MVSWAMLQGDCQEWLPEIYRAQPVDRIVCDPPFSEFVHANLSGNLTDQSVIVQREAGYDALGAEDRETLARLWLEHCLGWVVWFSDWESVGAWRAAIEANGGVWGRAIPWVRWSKPVSRYRIPSGSEAVCFARRKGAKVEFRGAGRTHYAVKCLRHQSKESVGYNGQKPIELMGEILEDIGAEPGMLVVDTHCGTGSTLLACLERGIDCIGIERLPETIALAEGRLGA